MNGYAFMCVCTDIIIQFTIAGLADSGVSDAAALLAELRLDSCRFQVRNRGVALNGYRRHRTRRLPDGHCDIHDPVGGMRPMRAADAPPAENQSLDAQRLKRTHRDMRMCRTHFPS